MDAKHMLGVLLTVLLFSTRASAQELSGEDILNEYERSLAFADYLGSDDLRASELLGASVTNAQGEELGQIEDLIISRQDSVVSAVISVGRLLGVGERRVAIPYEELRISPETRVLFLAMSEDALSKLPEYVPEERDLESLLRLRDCAAGESRAERRSTVTQERDDAVLVAPIKPSTDEESRLAEASSDGTKTEPGDDEDRRRGP